MSTSIPIETLGGTRTWKRSSASLRFRATMLLMLADALVILLSFTAMGIVRDDYTLSSPWVIFASLLVPVHLVGAVSLHAYAGTSLQNPFASIRKGEQALAIAIALVTLLMFYLKASESYSRLIIALGSIGSIILMATARYHFVRRLPAIVGGNPFSVILIRDGDAPAPAGTYSMVIMAEAQFDPDSDDPVMYDRLAGALHTADRVVIACATGRRMAWARALRGANIQGEIAIPELAQLVPLGMGPSSDVPAIIVAAGPLSLSDRLIKRAFDVVVASAAILALSGLLAAIALWIKIDSPGPVLFVQTRIGRGNRMFRMFKFRSMMTQDGGGHRSTARDDDRVTRSGRLIRRTSIDELPQLFNVLRGDMSIVGPRPHALGSRAADKLFWEVDRRYRDRHATKPGLTGLAQIRGFRGATVEEADLRNRLQADLEYLESWSIWRDLKIIFLTIRVLVHRNAY